LFVGNEAAAVHAGVIRKERDETLEVLGPHFAFD